MKPVVGFKEWQIVCEALGAGRQTVILRKGGIHESQSGFSFTHQAFFLFPTRFHTSENEVREGAAISKPEWQIGEMVSITHHAEVQSLKTMTDWAEVAALEKFHVYSEKTIRDRFDWEGRGMATGSIQVALVRVRELYEPWVFPYEAKYGGCRSWIHLPAQPVGWEASASASVGDQAFRKLEQEYQLA